MSVPAAVLVLCTAASVFAQDLPISGLSHVGFRVGSLAQADQFYSGVLGYERAFDLKNKNGEVALAFYKVNDDQYIEISPSLKPGQDIRFTHLAIETSDIRRLHEMLLSRGMKPGAMTQGRDGNLNFSLTDPDGHRVEFVQYREGSLHHRARGQFNDALRISTHLLHTGVTVANEAASLNFYRDLLGLEEIWRGGPKDGEIRYINLRIPGARGDYIELMLHSGKPTRQQYGSMHHICLEVPDIRVAYQKSTARGIPDTEDRHRPRIGRNRRWQMNIFDADGTRTEFMEPRSVD